MQKHEDTLAKVEAAVASTSVEALSPLLTAQVSTLIKPLCAFAMVPKTPAAWTSTSAGSLEPVWVELGDIDDASALLNDVPLFWEAGMAWILISDPWIQKNHATPVAPSLHTMWTPSLSTKKLSMTVFYCIDHIILKCSHQWRENFLLHKNV